MGASVSTANLKIEQLNSTDIGVSQKTFNEIINQCNSTTSQKNLLNIIGSTTTKLTTSQKNVDKNICILQTAINTVQDANATNTMMSAIKSALEQKSSAGLGIGLTNSNTDTSITNKFDANISNDVFNKAVTGCINDLDQTNVINIIGSNVTDSSLNQENDSFMSCLSNYGAETTQTGGGNSGISSSTDVVVRQTSEGYDFLGFFNTYLYLILGLCLLCVVSCLGSSLISVSGGGQSTIQSVGDSDMMKALGQKLLSENPSI